jgi:hypothetical protein
MTISDHGYNASEQGGPTFSSSVGPRVVFLLDPRAKKTLLALFLKSNSQFSSSSTILVQQ